TRASPSPAASTLMPSSTTSSSADHCSRAYSLSPSSCRIMLVFSFSLSPSHSHSFPDDDLHTNVLFDTQDILSPPPPIPRIPKHKLPWMIQAFSNGWSHFNPSYNITIIRPSTIDLYIAMPLPRRFWDSTTTHQQRANWVRLAILMEQGGFWIDASTILTGSLDPIIDRQQELSSEATYFLATVPHGRWITSWFAEYNTVFSNFACTDRYLDYLRKLYGDEGYDRIVQNINDPSYLKLTVASQRVLTHRLKEGGIQLPATEKAEDVPYLLLSASDYDDWIYAKNLLMNEMSLWKLLRVRKESLEMERLTQHPLVYKLRGPTRQALNEVLRNGTAIDATSVFINM
ncbi:hypothetical protein BC829DRAFT_404561, partial [Chytridium lagenaria]